MIACAADLKKILKSTFLIKSCQEEDPTKDLEAEIVLNPNIVVQIDWSDRTRPEYGVTIEPHHAKREYSGFRHVGYYQSVDALVNVLEKICPKRQTWGDLVSLYGENSGGTFHLHDLYEAFSEHPRAKENPNWRATLRKVVRKDARIRSIGPSQYSINL